MLENLSRTVRHVIAESAHVRHPCSGRHGVKSIKVWLLERALLILAAVGFVAAVLVSSRWLGNENFYSAITAITIVALWFKVARLTKLLREHGIDLYQKRAKDKSEPLS